MRCKFFLVLIVVFFISFISANFELGNSSYDIKSDYIQGEFISGWINISLSDVDLSSTFETSEGDTITILDLLELNDLLSECDTPNCDLDYDVSNAAPSKSLTLIEGTPQLIGFKFTEDLLNINSIDFQVQNNLDKSCYNQFRIDVFNDEDDSLDIKNFEGSGEYCSLFRTKGCFDEDKPVLTSVLSPTVPYCQKVELPESKGFRLGAYLVGISESKTATLSLVNLDGSGVASCGITVTGEGEFFCDDNGASSDETKEYYVCILGDGNLELKYYQDNENGCGFHNYPPGAENYSYNLIAYSHKFDVVGNFLISEKNLDFASNVNYYLESKYGGLGCLTKNCVVPIKIIPKVNQQMIFDSLSVNYETIGATRSLSNENFYDLSEIPLKYNSGFQKIYLDNANLSAGNGESFSLSLDGEEIFSQELITNVVSLIRSLNPQITAAAVPTEFSINLDSLDSNATIANYRWDFGNGDVRNTVINNLIYTYNSTGNFEVTVTIVDSNGLNNSKTFNVLVETPIRAVNKTLQEKLNSLNNLKLQLADFPVFAKDSLQPILNLVDVENKLIEVKTSFDSAVPGVTDSYYIGMMQDLLNIVLPSSISISKSADKLPFYFDESKIDLNSLTLLDGEYAAGREQEYKDAIISWNLNSLTNIIGYKEISANYGDGLEVLLNVFELNINKKEGSEIISYFILKNIDSFKFEKNYDMRKIENHIFIPLDTNSKIVFSTTEKISFSDLPLFIAPQIDNLNVLEEFVAEEEPISKWVFFGLIISLLVLIFIIFYIILQKWYAKKYENYLFKNKNDLYNLISFIENAKKKGTDDKKILVSLKKSGWKGEQLKYIIRKYLGKRTGMFEFPIEKILSTLKKKPVVSPANAQRRPIQKPRFNPNVRKNIRRK